MEEWDSKGKGSKLTCPSLRISRRYQSSTRKLGPLLHMWLLNLVCRLGAGVLGKAVDSLMTQEINVVVSHGFPKKYNQM